MTKLLGLVVLLAAAPALAMGTYDHEVSLLAWNAHSTSALLRSSYDYAGGKHVDYFIIGATGPVRSFSLGGDAVDAAGCASGTRELNRALARERFRGVRVTCRAVTSSMEDPTVVAGGDKAVNASWVTPPKRGAPNARERLAAQAEASAGLGGTMTVAISGKLVLVFGGLDRDQVTGKDDPDSGPTDFVAYSTASGKLERIELDD